VETRREKFIQQVHCNFSIQWRIARQGVRPFSCMTSYHLNRKHPTTKQTVKRMLGLYQPTVLYTVATYLPAYFHIFLAVFKNIFSTVVQNTVHR